MKFVIGPWLAITLAAALVGTGGVVGAEELPLGAPPPNPVTLWNMLGIPQGVNQVRDARVNRLGNRPQTERVDPLKRIADPDNLKSPNPAIQAAAEAKTEADLAPQKIKAIKFLATVGCCCPKNRAEVRDALLAALSDCTEAVRYEAAVALCQAAGRPCATCNSCSCCDPDVMTKLKQMAEGRDPNGCFTEASPRVRQAAAGALRSCEAAHRPTGTPPGQTPVGPDAPPERRPTPAPKPPAPPTGQAADPTPRIINPVSLGQVIEQDDARTLHVRPGAATPPPKPAAPQTQGNDGQPRLYSPTGMIQARDGQFGLASFQPPVQPTQPLQPLQPTPPVQPNVPTPGENAPTESRFGGAPSFESLLKQAAASAPSSAPSEGVTKGQVTTQQSTDTASLLAGTTQSVEVQRRSPVSFDPVIRGYKQGEIYSDSNGSYWMPVRQDMDTMLSKIDPDMIQDVTVINGPYGLRYGPGCAFIDVTRTPTPRYDCSETHFFTAMGVRANGGEFYARETAYGGGKDYGFRFSYGDRQGNPYLSGDDTLIPAAFHNRDVWAEFGFNTNPEQRIEFSFQRLDQTNAQYPCQFFDIGFLGTYGFEARVIDEDSCAPWTKLTASAWYNRTRINGNTDNKDNNPNYIEFLRITTSLALQNGGVPSDYRVVGDLNGGEISDGGRIGATFGDPDCQHINVGFDYRHLGQNMQEDYLVFQNAALLGGAGFYTNMPHAWMENPGAFLEWSDPLTEAWTLSLGVRGDWDATSARASDWRDGNPVNPSSLPITNASQLYQEDLMYAFYATNQYKLDACNTLTAGFGHSQTPPTLIERYADGLFMGVLQSGYTHVIGDPNLRFERDWQVDVGLSTKHDRWRAKANYFYAWVTDYITYRQNFFVNQPVAFPDARVVTFTNTGLATLTGFELFGEFDLASHLSAFGTMGYVQGWDTDINHPLPSMPPLASTAGLRLHDGNHGERWGIEFAARMVTDQDLVGWIHDTLTPIEERTPGFTVFNLRGYYNYTKNFTLTGGIENLGNLNYQEHLDLRLLSPTVFPPTRVLAPGLTPYAGVQWTF